jgi:hypothetical protein
VERPLSCEGERIDDWRPDRIVKRGPISSPALIHARQAKRSAVAPTRDEFVQPIRNIALDGISHGACGAR